MRSLYHACVAQFVPRAMCSYISAFLQGANTLAHGSMQCFRASLAELVQKRSFVGLRRCA
jgi:hypothetical protein